MKRMLETLYILTPESYLYLRNDNIVISVGGEEKASVPAVQIDSIVCFGKNTMSTAMLGFCGKHDITVSFLDQWGTFAAGSADRSAEMSSFADGSISPPRRTNSASGLCRIC